jgi:glutaconate CoA-transferase, subunit B
MTQDFNAEEFMAILCAREIRNGERFGVGVESPIPLVGALLALNLSAPRARLASRGIPGGPLLVGSHEFTSLAQQGKVDLFFLGAVQIDEEANLNLQYVGQGANRKAFLGAFAAPIYYSVITRVVVFRTEHSPRVFVKRVDCVTAAGRTAPRARRRGGPSKIITPRAVLRVSPVTGRIEIESFHPGETVASVQDATGFALEVPADVRETAPPSQAEFETLNTVVYPRLGPSAVPWLVR